MEHLEAEITAPLPRLLHPLLDRRTARSVPSLVLTMLSNEGDEGPDSHRIALGARAAVSAFLYPALTSGALSYG